MPGTRRSRYDRGVPCPLRNLRVARYEFDEDGEARKIDPDDAMGSDEQPQEEKAPAPQPPEEQPSDEQGPYEVEAEPVIPPPTFTTQKTPPVAPGPVEASSVRCVQCGYDLSGSALGGTCPECGTLVKQSLAATGGQGPTSGYAVTSLVLGIVSIPSCLCCGLPSLVCGILALVFANKAEAQFLEGASGQGLAMAGRICGIIGIVLAGLSGLLQILSYRS